MEPTQQTQTTMPAPQPKASSRKKLVMWLALAGMLILAAVGAYALWKINNDADSTPTEAAISIGQQGINPGTIAIASGQSVVITNRDTKPHNLKANETTMPGFDTPQQLNQGDSHSYTFEQKGTYRFYDPAEPNKYNATVVVE